MIAEAGANHNRDLGIAKELIDVAAERRRRRGEVPDVHRARSTRPRHRGSSTSTDDAEPERAARGDLRCRASGSPSLPTTRASASIAFFSTPFDHEAVDSLAAVGVPAMKIASFEIVDLPLIRQLRRSGSP